VPFFGPLPEPEPLSTLSGQYFASPAEEPINSLPGLGAASILLARAETTAIGLIIAGVYPTGISLTLTARLDPRDAPEDGPWLPGAHGQTDLRFGFGWPDGQRVEVADRRHMPRPALDGRYHLTPNGGSGGGVRYDQDYWLWPLPPAGSVTAYVMWEGRQIPETATELDLAPLVAWATEATPLWPLPEPRDPAGWFRARHYGGAYSSEISIHGDDPDGPGAEAP
jgi:hypothetical protein